MIALLIGVLLGVSAVAAQAQTGYPQITFGTPGPTTVPMTISWLLAPGATQHVIDGGYNDATAPFTVTSPTSPVTRPMSYHVSGAATGGWVCVTATVSGATIPSACNSYTVPAKPTTPPASTEIFVTFLEPSTLTTGPPLTNLAGLPCYWSVDGGPETRVLLPPSSARGGLKMTHSVILPYTSGIVRLQVSAITATGAESGRTPVLTKPLGPPAPGTIRVNTITQ